MATNTKLTLDEFLDRATNTFSSTIVVNQTTYNIENHWLKLAANYFNVDLTRTVTDPSIYNDVQDEISLLKTGLFGYFNSIASSEIKNAVYYKNTIYDEHFLNTASFPESIFNFAKLYNVKISMATPSHMSVAMTVRRDDLINSPMKTEIVSEQNVNIRALKTYQIVLDRDYNFTVGKYRFRLPYPVQIVMKQESIRDDDYSITARYLIDKNDSPYMDVAQSPQVKVYQDMAGSIRYVHFQLDLFQVDLNKTSFTVTSEDVTDTLFFPVTYTDQLANINAKYVYNGIEYPLDLYFNNTYTPEDPNAKFGYYTYVDDDTVQISFSSMTGSFRPKYNSNLVIEVETTKGSEGNFDYNDAISFNYTGDATDNYSSMITQVLPVNGSASGGSDVLSIWEEKQRIIEKVLGRDNLITDTDLKNFFRNMNSQNQFNGSSIEFIKKRDDILKRVWSAFLTLRDKNGKILQTNTAPYVDVPRSFFESNATAFGNNGFIIPEHTLVYYNPNQPNSDGRPDGQYILAENGLDTVIKGKARPNVEQHVTLRQLLDQNDSNYDRNALVYATPFLTKVDLEPVVQANYYMLDMNEDIKLNYKYLNDLVSDTFLINRAHIDRKFDATNLGAGVDSFNADTWNISFDLNTSESYNQSRSNIVVRGILMDAKSRTKYGYFNFIREDPDNDPTRYTAHLSTDRSFSTSTNTGSRLNLTNSLIDSSGQPINQQAISEDMILRIGVLYKDSNLRNNMDNDEVQLFLQDEFMANELNEDGSKAHIGDYALAMTSETINEFHLYKNLSNITTSFTSLVHDPTDPWNSEGGTGEAEKQFNGNNYIKNLLTEGAKTWVAINDEIKQVNDKGEATFTDADSKTEFTVKVIGANLYRYTSDHNHLYQMINSRSAELSFDATQGEFINDSANIRLDGLLAAIPSGVYISRYNKTFTDINGKNYEVVDSGNVAISYVNDKGLHYPLDHQGNPSKEPTDITKVDPNIRTIVAFYDGIYEVKSNDGKFVDNNGKTYQITGMGLFVIENGQRFKVNSAYNINRSRNYSDQEAEVGRPDGLFMVLSNTIGKADSLGIFKESIYPQNRQTRRGLRGENVTSVNSSSTNEINPQNDQNPVSNPTPVNTGEFMRVIIDGNYKGIYIILPAKDMVGKLEKITDTSTGKDLTEPVSSGADIYKLDMLGLATVSVNYKNDANFPKLYNIWNNKPAEEVKSNHNITIIGGNDDYVNMWNQIHNAENADGYSLAKAIGDNVFSKYVPDSLKDFRVEMFPLVGAQYFRYNYNYIYDILNSYIEVMNTTILRLENNTSIDMKFTNTYGPSTNWYISDRGNSTTSDGTTLRYMTRTDFLFDFTVHLWSSIDDAIDKKIKQFISDFVEASHDQNVIAVSNLISLLENNFDIIHFIEYNGLSGRIIDPTYINTDHNIKEYNYLPYIEQYNPIEKEGREDIIDNRWQRISNANKDFLDMTIEEIRYFVPEMPNIKKELHDNIIALDSSFLNYHNYKVSDDGKSIISMNASGDGSSSSSVDGDKGVSKIVTGQLYDYVSNLTYVVD